MYDVITVGGGPSGAYTSYLLAKEGLKVLLLDKGQPGGKLCTGVISEEAFQSFSLDRRCILRGIRSIEFVSPLGGGFIYEHPTPFAHAVDRKAFDSLLLDMAQEAGVSFLGEAVVTSLEVAKEGVRVRYGKNGQFQTTAQALALATGLNRRLLRMVGLKPPDYLNAVQIETDFGGEDQVKVFLGNKIAPGSFAWVVPLGDGTAKMGMSTRRLIMPNFRRFLRSLGIKDGIADIRSRSIPYGMAARTYTNRTLVIGDAAGHAKTTTGGGIYYGLIGASIAAEVLKEALSKGDFSEDYLQGYEERWKERLAPEIEMGMRLRGVFSSFDDERINKFIQFARNDGIATLINLQAKFDWQRPFFSSLLRRLDVKRLLGKNFFKLTQQFFP
ncbi:MAG: geranylgeranyl reductase family protein [Candidatus Brocadiales bacterium]